MLVGEYSMNAEVGEMYSLFRMEFATQYGDIDFIVKYRSEHRVSAESQLLCFIDGDCSSILKIVSFE